MSLDKSISSGKDKRKPFYGSKAVDQSCRDKTCPWCRGNATHKNERRKPFDDNNEAHDNPADVIVGEGGK